MKYDLLNAIHILGIVMPFFKIKKRKFYSVWFAFSLLILILHHAFFP